MNEDFQKLTHKMWVFTKNFGMNADYFTTEDITYRYVSITITGMFQLDLEVIIFCLIHKLWKLFKTYLNVSNKNE